jgi:hypothetical protein
MNLAGEKLNKFKSEVDIFILLDYLKEKLGWNLVRSDLKCWEFRFQISTNYKWTLNEDFCTVYMPKRENKIYFCLFMKDFGFIKKNVDVCEFLETTDELIEWLRGQQQLIKQIYMKEREKKMREDF